MPQAPRSESGIRFANDLRRIREARGVSLEELYDETKIPRSLIEAFEDSALVDHPQFNRVYLRSFTRTYANVVGISPDEALESLEAALSGTYRGELAVTYLGEEPLPPPPSAAPESGPEGAAGASASATPASGAKDRPAAKGSAAERKTDEGAAEEVKGEKTGTNKEAPPPTPPTPERPAAATPPPRREKAYISTTSESAAPAEDDSWETQSPASASATAASGSARRERRPAARRHDGPPWAWIVVGGLVLLAGLAWGIVRLAGDDDEASGPAVAPDSAAVEALVQERERPASLRDPATIPVLGDTMDFHVIAATGPLDPIRVTVDQDLRRPYWVDEGDSMAFGATNRIVFEELLDRVRLTLEGEEYPTDRRDPQGRLVITRDSADAFLASLAEQPADLSLDLDTSAAE